MTVAGSCRYCRCNNCNYKSYKFSVSRHDRQVARFLRHHRWHELSISPAPRFARFDTGPGNLATTAGAALCSGHREGIIPTGYGRKGDVLYIHVSAASRMPRTLADGVAVCVTMSVSDALVLARSAFNHSMNHRSVVIVGRATLVEDDNPPRPCWAGLLQHQQGVSRLVPDPGLSPSVAVPDCLKAHTGIHPAPAYCHPPTRCHSVR